MNVLYKFDDVLIEINELKRNVDDNLSPSVNRFAQSLPILLVFTSKCFH